MTYCTQCGEAASQSAGLNPVCAKCGAKLILPNATTKTPLWANLLVKPQIFGSLLLGLLALVLVAGFAWWSSTHLPDPQTTLRSFYSAIAEHDKDKLTALIKDPPANQPLNFCLNLLFQPNFSTVFSDLKYKTVTNKNRIATIRITGVATENLDGQTKEVRFNDLLTLQAVKNNWAIVSSSLDNLTLCGQ
jgi:hypothetical protein